MLLEVLGPTLNEVGKTMLGVDGGQRWVWGTALGDTGSFSEFEELVSSFLQQQQVLSYPQGGGFILPPTF